MSDALFQQALGIAAELFAKAGCEFRPMRDVPNRDAVPDPDRPVAEDVKIIFSEGAARTDLSNNGLGRNGVGVQSSFASRYILATLNAGALPYPPKKNDEILRGDGKLFRVVEPMPDGLGGYVLRLNEA